MKGTTNNSYDRVRLTNRLYDCIINELHPEYAGRNITEWEKELLIKAMTCMKLGDYEGVEKVYELVFDGSTVKQSKKSTKVEGNIIQMKSSKTNTNSLAEFFKSKGLEVIDKRDKGGCLWIVGSQREIGSIVREACGLFKAGGNYAPNGGRATGYRTAWFTKCGR